MTVYFLLLLVYQASEGREYLLSLEQDAVWLSERVLPFLAESSGEGDPEKCLLAARIVEVRT